VLGSHRRDVLFGSMHADPAVEYPFFSGYADETGTGAGTGFSRNRRLPVGTDARTWFAAFDEARATIDRSGADALVVSLGLDTFVDDPLTTCRLSSDDARRLGAKREKGFGLPVAFVLEGGYAAVELGVNVANVLDGYENG
jgi:acetoin utilization deacetylase AcuC-like enzyme